MSFTRKFLWLILIVVICFIIGQLILTGLLFAGGADISKADDIGRLIESMTSLIPFKIGIGLSNLIMFGVAAMIFAILVVKKKLIAYFNLKKIDISWLGVSFLFMLVAYPLVAYSSTMLSNIEFPSWMSNLDDQSMDTLISVLGMDTFGELILNLMIVAVIPAVSEELFFRGVVQKELVAKLYNPHMAIWITAFIFSAIHMQIEGFPPKFVIGLVLGYVYYYSKNLWIPILLHLFNNGSQLVALYFSGETIENIENIEQPDIHWAIALISLFLAFFMHHLLKTKSEGDVISA